MSPYRKLKYNIYVAIFLAGVAAVIGTLIRF